MKRNPYAQEQIQPFSAFLMKTQMTVISELHVCSHKEDGNNIPWQERNVLISLIVILIPILQYLYLVPHNFCTIFCSHG